MFGDEIKIKVRSITASNLSNCPDITIREELTKVVEFSTDRALCIISVEIHGFPFTLHCQFEG